MGSTLYTCVECGKRQRYGLICLACEVKMQGNQRPKTETADQCEVARWLKGRGALYFHVPNGGYRSGKGAQILKQMGVRPGVPDLLIIRHNGPQGQCQNVALELKQKGSGKQGGDQVWWQEQLEQRGWVYLLAHGATEAIRMLEMEGV